MVHFLRNENNRTIIECQTKFSTPQTRDLSAAVNITNYSLYLLDITYDDFIQQSFIEDITALSEIRGWWWEGVEDSGLYKSVDEFVEKQFQDIAKKYNLNYITG